MHPRNFGYETIVRTSVRTPPFHVSRGEILHFKYSRVLAVNRIATRTLRDNKNNNNKAEELQREMTSKGDQFCWKNNMSENFIDETARTRSLALFKIQELLAGRVIFETELK